MFAVLVAADVAIYRALRPRGASTEGSREL